MYITTAGVGLVGDISGTNARPGDVIILSGMIDDHGTAALGERNELELQSSLQSDAAP